MDQQTLGSTARTIRDIARQINSRTLESHSKLFGSEPRDVTETKSPSDSVESVLLEALNILHDADLAITRFNTRLDEDRAVGESSPQRALYGR